MRLRIAQAGEIELRPRLQHELVVAHQRVDLTVRQIQAPVLNLFAQALPEVLVGAGHAGCGASENKP